MSMKLFNILYKMFDSAYFVKNQLLSELSSDFAMLGRRITNILKMCMEKFGALELN